MSTPMIEQYNSLKKQYKDCILLFRLGDFYEGFDEDAKVLSKVLGIALTGRGKDENRRPMAGIPHHALKAYLPKLIKAGYKVAIGEQQGDVSPGKLVDRNVTKVITPGTVLEEKFLEASENNYLVSIYLISKRGFDTWGVSYADLSTGEFKVMEILGKSNTEIPRNLISEVFQLRPAEIIIPRFLNEKLGNIWRTNVQIVEDIEFSMDEAKREILENFKVKNLKGFGIENLTSGLISAGALLSYLLSTQKRNLGHITKISLVNDKEFMILDNSTIRNLELLYPIQNTEFSKTFFETINQCQTSMGQRLLRQWILRPLIQQKKIMERLDFVEEFFLNPAVLDEIRILLNDIPDLERVLARIATQNCNARDLLFLKIGLQNSINVLKILKANHFKDNEKNCISEDLATIINEKVIGYIENAIKEDPALTITEGNIINENFIPELTKIKEEEKIGKDYIRSLQASEIKRTGINSLKVRFNKIFGYYIEITKSNADKAPSDYIRKQTLVNAERFVTEDLKKWEEKVLGAEERAATLEYKIFEEVRTNIISMINKMNEVVEKITFIDVISSLAYQAKRNNYVKPVLTEDKSENTLIIDGRHPVVESIINDEFIPNDLSFNSENQQVIILTGPNMSGKSTYIRQNALIFLMAQIGSYVPAKEARIVLADRIFTRVGASDNLASGESTFMVEMNETANILNNATDRSLIILDEVGRGTSTYDGVAIAWAVVEYIYTKIQGRTLFATHYHELIELEGKYSGIKNFNVEVKETDEKVLFMRKIIPGGTDKSYGIHVAEIAGLPNKIIERANEILGSLEAEQQISIKDRRPATQLAFSIQNDEENFLKKEIEEIDIDLITPLDALVKLKELKDKSK